MVGALGGALLGLSENLRIMASRDMVRERLDLGGMLASVAQALAIDGVAIAALLAVSQDYLAYAAGKQKGTAEDFALLRALYDDDMTYLDERIGEIIAALRDRGILDNTLVIVTSDHGEELGEHGLLDHCFEIYNTMLRVPLIIRYPGEGPRGTRRAEMVQTTDLFATVLDVAGVAWKRGPHIHSRSLASARPAVPARSHVVAERYVSAPWASGLMERFPRWRGVPLWRRLRGVQDAEFKYVWGSDGEERLFDLRDDPGETKNVLAEHPAKARELKAILASELPPPQGNAPNPVAQRKETQ